MEQLVTVIIERRNIGSTLIPFYAESGENEVLSLIEQATAEHIGTKRFEFSPEEIEVVKLLNSISEQNLFKRFSKQKNLKFFFDNLEEKFTLEHIRPLIDQKVSAAFEIIASADIPVYYRNPNYHHMYSSDRIKVNTVFHQPHFEFTLEPNGLRYTLKIKTENEVVGLTNREIVEVSSFPSSFLINRQLFRFENIDGKKFKPFLRVNHLLIPRRSVETYMASFVKTCIRDYHVKAKGFQITDKEAKLQPLLVIEKDLSQNTILTLKFKYDANEYSAGIKSMVFVDHRKINNHFIFERLRRNVEEEQCIVESLLGLGLKSVNNAQFRPLTEGKVNDHPYAVIEWMNCNSEKLLSLGFKIMQNGLDEKYYAGNVKLSMQYKEDNDWFDINAVIIVDDFKIPFLKIRHHIIRGKREYLLPDGAYFIIPEEWFTKYTDLMHFSRIEAGKMSLGKMHFNLLDQNRLEGILPGWKHRMEKLHVHTADEPVPHGLKAALRPYQHEGFTWMMMLKQNRFGGILADDMGLGKTIQTITLLLSQYETALPPKRKEAAKQLSAVDSSMSNFNNGLLPASLIVMPTSLVHNWTNEIAAFAPRLKVYSYTGNSRTKSKDIGKILKHYHIVLTSYGIARNDIEYLKNYNFQYIILDESQNIKNPGSKIYQAVSKINANFKLVLTGTPIENALTDLWAQMNFVNTGLLGNLNFFKDHFVGPIEKSGDEDKELKLKKLINPFILRRTKEMVAKDLPPLTEQTLVCDMTEEQQKFYEQEKSGIRNELLKASEQIGLNKNAILALQGLTKLRQIANHPALVDKDYTGSSGKYEQIFEKLEIAVNENHKVLIFSSFVKDLELIEKDIQKQKIKYSKLTGATSDRQKAINQFTDDASCHVFLISLKAGGVGLNLVEADYVFMLNPWWNPAVESQAINRAHRIGQTKNVFVYKFISADSIEEKIAKLQEKKAALADSFITTTNPLKNLSETELHELFA